MNIFQVMCFVTLSHMPTFHEAAEKTYISQSSFSYNINAIETQLGVSLVERGAREFKLTDAGRAFLPYAENITNEYNRMIEKITEYKNGSKNRIRLFVDTLTSFGYNETLTAFRRKEPEIQTEITEMGGMDVIETLDSWNNAACVVFSSGNDSLPGTRRCTLLRDNFAIIVKKSNPLSKQPSIKLRDLDGKAAKVVLARSKTFLYDYVAHQFEDADVIPDIGAHTLWHNTMVDVVRELDLVAIIPSKVAGIFCPSDLKAIDIVDADSYSVDLIVSDQCEHHALLRFFDFANNPV